MTKLNSLIKVAIGPGIVIKALKSRMKVLKNHSSDNKELYENLYRKTNKQINSIKGKFQDKWLGKNVTKGSKQFNDARKNDEILGNAISELSDKNRIHFGI